MAKEAAEEMPIDLCQATLDYEEVEVKRRTEKEDQDLFSKTSDAIRLKLKDILDLKTAKPKDWAAQVEERRVQIAMLILTLRHISRLQKVRVHNARSVTSDARQGVDVVTLQLQNLLYEVSHLKKEVRKCLEFKSADQEIELVTVDQFYKDAPVSISRPDETSGDPHQQKLARLHWELEQRKGQTQLFEQLTLQKEELLSVIQEETKKLSSILPRINAILEATQPLQEALDFPLDAQRLQQKNAQLLPSPLYTLWMQASSYAEACDPVGLTVLVVGDVEKARKLLTSVEEPGPEASDSENDQDQQEENASRPRKSHKGSSIDKEESESGTKQVFTLFPLHVSMTVKTASGDSVTVSFYYLQSLNIVTVKCEVNTVKKTKSAFLDVTSGDSLLNCLSLGDDGLSSPNSSSFYVLQKFQLPLKDALEGIGKPYKWAQSLAGFNFLTDYKDSEKNAVVGSEESDPSVSSQCMHRTVLRIRKRLKNRVALHAQLCSLEMANANGTSSIALPVELLREHFPAKIDSVLKEWKPVSWDDYCQLPQTSVYREAEVVTQHSMLFKARFERKIASLEALVAISPDYPVVAPVLAFTLNWEGQSDSATNPRLRQMEAEVNLCWKEFVSSSSDQVYALPLMMLHTALCLDIYTEASSNLLGKNSGQEQFPKEKIFLRCVRGPDRGYPFKYLPKLGVFTHR